MQHKNVTLRLPDDLLQQFRVYAAERNQSMTSLMAEAIRAWMDQDHEREQARERLLKLMEEAEDLGTHGVATWTRDELHER